VFTDYVSMEIVFTGDIKVFKHTTSLQLIGLDGTKCIGTVMLNTKYQHGTIR